ncbi:T9SS C-terminal target domain-containing protein [Hymenobacter sediminis]|uniref:T9SS type A sorting domain-containing protein n=1 Tax=Hymenobacter sediminis TaxID=2218621 RepID=UPI000F4FB302|nr:T9SS type A sorting domain-containing protein [Hymenobacter sediminis]RPD49450.1 T9SS C-terminal target domain-containing protein [Hymenobacter sediminis]
MKTHLRLEALFWLLLLLPLRVWAAPSVGTITNNTTVRRDNVITAMAPLATTAGTATGYRITALPPAAQGVLYIADAAISNYIPVVANTVYTPQQAQYMAFAAKTTATLTTTSFTFQAGDATGFSGNGTYNLAISAAQPVAVNEAAPIIPKSFGATALKPLESVAADGSSSASKYRILSIPTRGVLRVNGITVSGPVDVALADIGKLTYDPDAASPAGNYSFTYAAYVTTTATSAAANYSLPVSNATCGQNSAIDFSERTVGEDWKNQPGVAVGNTTLSTSNYTSTVQAGQTDLLGISYQPGVVSTQGLVWQLNNQNVSGDNRATVQMSFSRPVRNLAFAMEDIDISTSAGNGSDFIDEVTFNAYALGSSTPFQLSAADVALASNNTNVFVAGTNTIKGTGVNNGPAGTVVLTFPASVAISRLEIIYRNTQTYTAGVSRTQTVNIPSMVWCAEVDLVSTLTGPTRAQAGQTVSYVVTTENRGDINAAGVRATVQLVPNLQNVTFPGGTNASYNATNGLLTLADIGTLTPAQKSISTISFTMPASGSVNGQARSTTTGLDVEPVNNNGSLAAANISTSQNRAPVANNVTNSPAMLSTNAATTINPFNATDPDATTSPANTTIASFTIVTLPTAAQGILYVNGAAATAGQVITVPSSATPSAPGYVLSFDPAGTFAGTASFTYRATDDLGVASNTATYDVPVTPGADIVTTISGATSGVEGQTRTYSASVTNNGPATANGVVTTITLSNKPPFNSVTVSNGSYDAATGIVTFNAVTLVSGAKAINTLTLVAQAGPYSFTATAASTSATADPDATNNNGTASNSRITTAVTQVGPAATTAQLAPCATPGKDLSPTISTAPNAYYPAGANQTVSAGATTLVVGAPTGNVSVPITAGDLLLIIQMQGADIDVSDSDSYGDGIAGGFATGYLNNNNFTAGQYEYAVAAGPISNGTLTLTTGLKNSYQNVNYNPTTGSGQRRFQVIRVPQYANLTLGASLTAAPWNGSTGGLIVLDVTGQLNFNGFTIDASGIGFRGGAGRTLNGATGQSGTTYRSLSTVAAHAMKGEGIAGTPRYVTSLPNAATPGPVDTGVEGYFNGSAGRGAAGNAGGGGTDANPTANDQNSGGGGGGNGARGGRGGNAWTSAAAVGGEPGIGFGPPSSSRLIMGGGGGAGVTNNGSGGNAGYASSGAPGGGIVMIRTGSVNGTGSILANGASASNAVIGDGSGGAGAGGSILLTANNPSGLGSISLAANGGKGGTNSATAAHGPGGGGGGGVILTNAPVASASVAAGQNGLTAGSTTYSAEAGVVGLSSAQISRSIANSTAGINCSVDITATITGPAAIAAGQTVTLTANFANNGGQDATGVTRQITLPKEVTNISAPNAVVTGDATSGYTITYPTLPTLSAGTNTSFGVSYTAPGTASVAATATTSSGSAETITTNNTQTVTTQVLGSADIVTALSGLTTLNAGRPSSTYTVVYANNGPAAANNVTRTVTLPAGIAATDLTVRDGASYTYNEATGIIDFGTLSTVNSRDAQSFRFSFLTPSNNSTIALTSNTTTTSDQGSNLAGDSFVINATINNVADVESRITVPSGTVTAGQTGTFNVAFLNNGPSVSTGVLRRVQLPANLQNVVASNGGTYDPATGIVTYASTPDLPSGSNASSVITFTAPATGPVTATANMNDGTIFSGQSNNNQSTAFINISPIADITTSISSPAPTVAGNLATFTVLTSNNGPSPASAVQQQVQLPANLSGVFASNGGTYNNTTGVVTFPALSVLPTGVVVNNTISFVAPATGFTATASVTSATAEASGTTANNTAAAPASVVSPATTDLANVYTTVQFSSSNVAPDVPVVLTVTTGNNGPKPAASVAQQVALLPGLTNVTASGSGNYNPTTGIVTFPAIASQLSGTSVTNTITLNSPIAGSMTATASVTAATSDPMPANNLATTYLEVNPVTDVVTLLTGPSTASVGQVLTLTVATRNQGLVAATNVRQTTTIPAGIDPTLVTVSGDGTYDSATGTISFPTVSLLEAGESRLYTITYKAPAFQSTDNNAPRTFETRATVTTTSPEAVTSNNIATEPIQIKWNADIAVTVDGPAAAIVGNPVTYVVATLNNGPSPAVSIAPSVRITTGLTNVVASGGGVYNSQTGIVTFPIISNLPSGSASAVSNTITFTVPDRPLIGVSAIADVPIETNDANLTNNAVSLIVPVRPATANQVDLRTTIAANVTTQNAGQPVLLTVTATNDGDLATGIRERVTLPIGLSSVLVRNSDGNVVENAYNPLTGVVTFPATLTLNAGASATFTVLVSDANNDPLVATASINGTSYSDPVAANNTSSVSVNITPVVDVLTRISGPAAILPNAEATIRIVTLNNGPSTARSVAQKLQLPTGLTKVLVSGGGSYDPTSGTVTFPTAASQAAGATGEITNTVSFRAPSTAFTATASVITTTTGDALDNNAATLQIAMANQVPTANNYVNRLQTPQGNTGGPLQLSSLSGFDQDGSLASFSITSLPPTTQGTLLLNGSPVGVGQVISVGNAANLYFDPASAFVGSSFFTYTVTDNQGAVSSPAHYTIVVGQDNNSVYTNTPVKGGANVYNNADILSNGFDLNGGTYDSSVQPIVTDNGIRSAMLALGSNDLPAGVSLNPTTGALFVSDRSQLSAGSYTVTITTIDANGGMNTQPVNFRIGDRPLPVTLVSFTAQAAGADAKLLWRTSQELNNERFVVERSFNGTSFQAIGQVQGQGTSAQAHDYAFSDRGVGSQAAGTVYYRLRQVDTDGTSSLSPVQVVRFAKALTAEVAVYPNPTSNTADTRLDLSALPAGTYRVLVTDMAGRSVRSFTQAGGTNQSLDVRDLPLGSYLLTVEGNGQRFTQRLVKE